MTNHRSENGRRELLLTVAGGIAGLAVGSLPARVLAQSASGPPLSISTIGAGLEGGALGALFVKAGHRVMFSSRHPDTLKGLVDELVMVVVPYTAMEQIGRDYGNALAKKVLVIDVSNPIARRDDAEIVKWVDDHGGAGLATAKYLSPHVVRAFNAIGYAKLSTDAHRQGELVGVPIAGDDAQRCGRFRLCAFGPFQRRHVKINVAQDKAGDGNGKINCNTASRVDSGLYPDMGGGYGNPRLLRPAHQPPATGAKPSDHSPLV